MLVKKENIKKCNTCQRYHIVNLVNKKRPQYDRDNKKIEGFYFECTCDSTQFIKIT